ncbi:MAG TPA: helix-turn-helix domain-containing protein [Gammaproteobacteria bacterium]|nr:helix-turn-helix domain-containing protein [Gammaproteobacteria bacterium]
MTTPRSAAAGKRPLDILGINETEEQLYRTLIARPGASVPELARGLMLAPGRIQRLLEALEAKGLATHTPERPRRYLPASPDIAMEALVLRRQEDLQRARGVIRELQEQSAATRRGGEQEQMVELVTSEEAERHIVEQMSRSARNEMVALVRPPMLISRLDVEPDQDSYTQREAERRGVRSRSIVDSAFLALPGAVARVQSDMRAGEDVRVISWLPFKMVATDRRLALIPLDLEQSASPVLLVRSPALLEALYVLFEILWERSSPIALADRASAQTDAMTPPLPPGAQELLSLMAAGLNDKKIASELRISASTLNRRIGEIMKLLDARSRFQTGWLAALRFRPGEQTAHPAETREPESSN